MDQTIVGRDNMRKLGNTFRVRFKLDKQIGEIGKLFILIHIMVY